MPDRPEIFVIGASADTEAEYGCRSDRPVSILHMCDGEIYAVEGAETIASARAALLADDVLPAQIESL